MSEKDQIKLAPPPYVTPKVVDLGDVRKVTLGSAKNDTADMNTARYW